MSKRLLCIVIVVLTVSSITWAGSFFAGGQVNGSLRIGPYSTGTSVNCSPLGSQAASTQGCSGSGLVLQGQGAAGSQYRYCGTQGQCLTAGQGQIVANTGTGSASGAQFGGVGQTQSHYSCLGSQSQSQYTAGGQIGMAMGTNCASLGMAGGMGSVGTYQYQTY
jgi:hypothetical protein